MSTFIKLSKFKLSLMMLMLVSSVVQSQTSSPITANTKQETPILAIVLTLISIILVFVIWGMGQALMAVSKLVRDKQKNKAAGLVLLMILLTVGTELHAQTPQTVEAVTATMSYGGMSSSAFYSFVTVIAAELFLIAMLALFIKRLYAELIPEKATGTNSLAKIRKWWHELDKKLLTKATPVEKEMDVLLDHDYDGIKELDNALPPWWKYGFYVTIVIGIIYMTHFHVFGTGKNPTEEYQTEMEFARLAKEEYDAQNKDKIDENNVPMSDIVGIGVGNELFHQPGMCASCHGQMGEGGAGPNLTDDYWIHKGSLNDIYMSIKKGYPDKGMQSWESAFTPKQISQLASYIKSIRGTNPPNAQAPKGDLYVEAVKDTMNAVDTAKK